MSSVGSAEDTAAEDDRSLEVQDDGTVDQRIKKRILDARQRVDDREDYLYVEAPVEDSKTANTVQQDVYWGMVVKQFLRTIEPLLRSDDIDRADDYYHTVALGNVQLVPRSTENYPFEKYATGTIGEQAFKMQYNLPRSVSLPEPKTEPFVGLKSVIETDGIVCATWTIETNSWTDPSNQGIIQTADERPIPKHIYENAVREADEFLQQSGIGLEIGREPHGHT